MHHPPLRADGKIETVVTSLEMLAPPDALPLPAPRDGLDIEQAVRPTVSFYRYLYDALGAVVQDPAVEIYVLWVQGVPAGYAELDGRVPGEIELAYLGIMPEFIGQKLGPYLLDFAIRTAWARDPRRLWVHTCTLDHPGALGMYERAGFRVFRREREIGDDLRALRA